MAQCSTLRVSGNKFVNAQGETVQLRGVNNIGSHYVCLTAPGPYDPVFGGVPSSKSDLAFMAGWGCNCVRLSINASCWLNAHSPFTGGSVYQTAILRYVADCNALGMYVIFNLVNTISGTGEMADSDATAFWQSAIPILNNNPGVLVEAYNEPHSITWATWLNGGNNGGSLSYTSIGHQALVNTIRTSGWNGVILLDGISYAGDLTSWIANLPTDSLNQLAASWHRYSASPPPTPQDIGTYDVYMAAIRTIAQSYPVVASECGGYTGDTAFLIFLCQFMDSLGQSYLPWAWCVGAPVALLSDYNGAIPSTYAWLWRAYMQQRQLGNMPHSTQNTRQQVIPTLAW